LLLLLERRSSMGKVLYIILGIVFMSVVCFCMIINFWLFSSSSAKSEVAKIVPTQGDLTIVENNPDAYKTRQLSKEEIEVNNFRSDLMGKLTKHFKR